MKKIFKVSFMVIMGFKLLTSGINELKGQSAWNVRFHFHAGANIFLNNIDKKSNRKHYKFPGFRTYVSGVVMGEKGHLLLHYSPTISIYHKTLGANLNRYVFDIQMDWVNTVSVGMQSKKHIQYYKMSRTLHNGDFYNLHLNSPWSMTLSTNLILNNHKRHQVVGSIHANLHDVSLNYYNDGPPFHMLGVSDGFDRYWTGGGHIMIHHPAIGNQFELSYDQFTGYAPLLYELSNILGIHVPMYQNDEKKNTHSENYNSSSYHLKIGMGRHIGLDVGILGNLISKNNRYWGLQDIIHNIGKLSLHPNQDINRLFIGATYKYHYPEK